MALEEELNLCQRALASAEQEAVGRVAEVEEELRCVYQKNPVKEPRDFDMRAATRCIHQAC